MAGKKRTVYVETSVVSALVDLRKDPIRFVRHQSSVKWWKEQRPHFMLFTSEAAYREIADTPILDTVAALAILDEMTRLPLNDEVRATVKIYQENLLMPNEAVGDAAHLAVASLNKMDYLLTWNCQHLANTNKIKHVQVINRRLGLLSPVLVTPDMLVWEADDEDH